MSEEITTLQDSITPNISSILWLDDCYLTDRPKHTDDFDYFVDGLLAKYIFENKDNSEEVDKNFFISSQFGEPFYLSFFNALSSKLEKNLSEIINIVKSNTESENKKVLIINNSNKNINHYLAKNFSEVDFQVIKFNA